MNIVPYRAKLPDLPLPEKRHGGAFRTVPWERYNDSKRKFFLYHFREKPF